MNFTAENICKWALENREMLIRWLRPHGGKSLLLNNELKKGPALLIFIPYNPLEEIHPLLDEVSEILFFFTSKILKLDSCSQGSELNCDRSSFYLTVPSTWFCLEPLSQAILSQLPYTGLYPTQRAFVSLNSCLEETSNSSLTSSFLWWVQCKRCRSFQLLSTLFYFSSPVFPGVLVQGK